MNLSFWSGVIISAPIFTLGGFVLAALLRINRDTEEREAIWQAGRQAGRIELAVRHPDVIPIETALEGTDLGIGADKRWEEPDPCA